MKDPTKIRISRSCSPLSCYRRSASLPSSFSSESIVVINVHKRFYLFFFKKRVFNVFLFFQRFLFLKTLNNHCENNSNLIHLCPKTENQTAAHNIIADFIL